MGMCLCLTDEILFFVYTNIRKLIGWSSVRMIPVLPVQRLKETDTLIAFHHPKPSYPMHILLVPKRAIVSLSEVSEEDGDFFADLCRCGLSLVLRCKLEQSGYRLILNGGAYQEFPQLHFHLTSNEK